MAIFKWGVLLVALLMGAVALGAGIATAHDGGTEVRITAMRLDDGRIEFALQERDGEGWGERILPSSRFFPTTSSGRWLNSTPITVGAVEGMAEPTATAAATPAPTTTAFGTRTVSGHWAVSTRTDPITDVVTTSAILPSAAVVSKQWSYSDLDDPFIALRCNGDTLEALVFWDTYMGGLDERLRTTYRVDQNAAVAEWWNESTTSRATFAPNPEQFVTALLGGTTVAIRSVDYSGEAHTLTMRMTGLSDVLGNLSCYN